MFDRYQARMNSQTGEVAIIDTVAKELVRVVGVTAAAMREALDDTAHLNEMERVFQSQPHTVEAFTAQWKGTVN